jgi:TonB family protein
VVAQNQPLIRRRCWQPALDARSAGAPSNARVNVNIVISPSGNVTSASASGGENFPGLASCIADRVRGWKFPPSGGPTSTSVPFVFAGQ